MKKYMPVKIDSESFYFSIPLEPFIVEWEKTKDIYISCIAKDIMTMYGGAKLQHFVSSSSDSLADSWCKYRIFGGIDNLILRPDELQFKFENVLPTDFIDVANFIAKCFTILLPKLGYENIDSFSININSYVTFKEGTTNEYFRQYDTKVMAAELSQESDMHYLPSVNIIFQSENRDRVLRRTVEPSEISKSDLFITTNIYVLTSKTQEFYEEFKLLFQAINIANQTVGLELDLMEEINNALFNE